MCLILLTRCNVGVNEWEAQCFLSPQQYCIIIPVHALRYMLIINKQGSGGVPSAINYWLFRIFTARKRSLGQGNIFAPVCHSVHRESTWTGTPLASTPPGRYTPQQVPPRQVHPPSRYPLQVHRPPWQVHFLGRYTPGQVHPPQVHPLAVHARIRSTSGRYASYWNAFLLNRCEWFQSFRQSIYHCWQWLLVLTSEIWADFNEQRS